MIDENININGDENIDNGSLDANNPEDLDKGNISDDQKSEAFSEASIRESDEEEIVTTRNNLKRLFEKGEAHLYESEESAAGDHENYTETYLTLKDFADRTGLPYEWLLRVIKADPDCFGARYDEDETEKGSEINFRIPMSAEDELLELYGEYKLYDLFRPEDNDAYHENELMELFPLAERGWVRGFLDDFRFKRTGHKQGAMEKRELTWSGSEMIRIMQIERNRLEITDGVSVFSKKQLEKEIIKDSRFIPHAKRAGAIMQILSYMPKTKAPMICGERDHVVNWTIKSEDVEAGWRKWNDFQKIRIDSFGEKSRSSQFNETSPEEEKIINSQTPPDYHSDYDSEDTKYE